MELTSCSYSVPGPCRPPLNPGRSSLSPARARSTRVACRTSASRVTRLAVIGKATTVEVDGAATSRAMRRSDGGALPLNKSSDAMERLDIERGVCVPFRKYTPEMVLFFRLRSLSGFCSGGIELGELIRCTWSGVADDVAGDIHSTCRAPYGKVILRPFYVRLKDMFAALCN